MNQVYFDSIRNMIRIPDHIFPSVLPHRKGSPKEENNLPNFGSLALRLARFAGLGKGVMRSKGIFHLISEDEFPDGPCIIRLQFH